MDKEKGFYTKVSSKPPFLKTRLPILLCFAPLLAASPTTISLEKYLKKSCCLRYQQRQK